MAVAMAVAAETPGQLYNWNLTEASSPAVITQARTVEDVERVLKNDADFPSPVRCTAITHTRELAVVIMFVLRSHALAMGNDAGQQHVAPAASPCGGPSFALLCMPPAAPVQRIDAFNVYCFNAGAGCGCHALCERLHDQQWRHSAQHVQHELCAGAGASWSAPAGRLQDG